MVPDTLAPTYDDYSICDREILDLLEGLTPSQEAPIRKAIENLQTNPRPAGFEKSIKGTIKVYRYPVQDTDPQRRLVYLIDEQIKRVDIIGLDAFR